MAGLVRVSITIETPAGITSVSREENTAVPGGSRPLVLPVLLSAVKAAAGPYLDEVAIIRNAVEVLADALAAVNRDKGSAS